MKIISKYKDYYDYLVGAKFGLDNNVVLDRTKGIIIDNYLLKSSYQFYNYKTIKIAICGKLYEGICDVDGNVYWNNNMIPFGEFKKDWKGNELFYINVGTDYRPILNPVSIHPIETKINEEENCPIVFVTGNRNQNREIFPCLKNTKIASIYPPEKIFMDVYNWISKRNETNYIDNRTDIEKLEAKGFNKKNSFRKIK